MTVLAKKEKAELKKLNSAFSSVVVYGKRINVGQDRVDLGPEDHVHRPDLEV